MKDQIAGQVELLDYLNSLADHKEIQEGSSIWKVVLDQVHPLQVQKKFFVNGKEMLNCKRTDIPIFDTVCANLLDETLFLHIEEAEQKAAENRKKVLKFSPRELEEGTITIRSYCIAGSGFSDLPTTYTYKTIALTRYGVYVKENMLYPFLHCYPDKESAEKQFVRMCRKIEREKTRKAWQLLSVHFAYEDVYRCSDEKYAGLEYAVTNGHPYKKGEKP